MGGGRTQESGSAFSSAFFFMLALALAAAIHVVVNADAQRERDRQARRLENLSSIVKAEEATNRRLELEKDALQHDPQMIERRLRKEGWGLQGDVRVELAGKEAR